jgi:hypothetical protein
MAEFVLLFCCFINKALIGIDQQIHEALFIVAPRQRKKASKLRLDVFCHQEVTIGGTNGTDVPIVLSGA